MRVHVGEPSLGEDAQRTAALDFLRISLELETPGPHCPLHKTWSALKRALAAVFLLPLRVVLLALTGTLLWLVYRLAICCAPARKSGENGTFSFEPHTRAERALLWATWPLYRLVLLWFGVVWVRVKRPGKESKAGHGAAATIVLNHVSTLDCAFIGYLFGAQVTGVAMRWVTRAPFFATLSQAHHVLAVGREKAPSGPKVAPESEAAAAEAAGAPQGSPKNHAPTATDTIIAYQRLCRDDPRLFPMVVFPEGTTKASRCLVKFRAGAFVSGEPVQPVALAYPAHFAWVGSMPSHLWYLLTAWFCYMEVVFLPCYVPCEAERQDPQLYATNVQAAVAAALHLQPERSSRTLGARALSALPQKKGH